MDAWTSLPDPVKRGIIAMIDAAGEYPRPNH